MEQDSADENSVDSSLDSIYEQDFIKDNLDHNMYLD
jgi:hypothetical protein